MTASSSPLKFHVILCIYILNLEFFKDIRLLTSFLYISYFIRYEAPKYQMYEDFSKLVFVCVYTKLKDIKYDVKTLNIGSD